MLDSAMSQDQQNTSAHNVTLDRLTSSPKRTSVLWQFSLNRECPGDCNLSSCEVHCLESARAAGDELEDPGGFIWNRRVKRLDAMASPGI